MSDIGSITYRMGVDDQVTPSVEKIVQSIQNLENVTRDIGTGTGQGFSAMERQLSNLQGSADATVNLMTQGFENLNLSSKDIAAGLSGLCSVLVEVAEAAKKNVDATTDNGARLENINKEIEALKQEVELLEQSGDAAEESAEKLDTFDKTIKNIVTSAAGLFTLDKLVDFGKDIINTRKQMSSLRKSFETLLGSQEKAEKMFSELNEFAVQTPMQIEQLAGGMQTLLSFGTETDKVIPILKEIGDISMGDAEKFNSLTLAFSQMSASGKLMGQDLMQMINAGFNPLEEISRTTGKSIGELKDEMSKGAISAEMVQEAFKSATEEGGKFYGLLAGQSETLAGALSNFDGAITNLKDNLGASLEGPITNALNLGTKLANNWETIAATLESLIGALGAYKATLAAVKAMNWLDRVTKATKAMEAYKNMTTAAALAQRALTAAKSFLNPWALLAAGITAATIALVKYAKQASKPIAPPPSYAEEQTKEMETELEKVKKLINQAKGGDTIEASAAWKELQSTLPAIKQYYATKQELEKADQSQIEATVQSLQNGQALVEAYQDEEILQHNKLILARKKSNATTLNEAANYQQQLGATDKKLREVHTRIKELEQAEDDLNRTNQASKQSEREQKQMEDLIATMNDETVAIYKRRNAYNAASTMSQKIQSQYKKQLDAAKKAIDAQEKANKKADETTMRNARKQLAKQDDQLAELERQTQLQTQQVKLDAMDEGLNKTIDKIQYNKERELEAIEKARKEQLEKLQNDEWTKYLSTPAGAKYARENPEDTNGEDWIAKNAIQKLPESYSNQFVQQEANAIDSARKETQRALESALASYKTLAQQIEETNKQYDDLQNHASTVEQKQLINAERAEKLQDLVVTSLSSNKAVKLAWGDLEDQTATALEAIKKQLEDYKETCTRTLSPIELQALNDKIKEVGAVLSDKKTLSFAQQTKNLAEAKKKYAQAKEELAKAQEIGNPEAITTAIEKEADAAKKYEKEVQKAKAKAQQFAQVMAQLGDILTETGEAMSGVGGLAVQIMGQLVNVAASACSTIAQTTAKTAAELSTLEKASVILAVVQAVIQAAQAIANALGGSETQEDYNKMAAKYQDLMAVMDDVIDKQKELIESLSGDEATEAYQTSIDLINEEIEATKKAAKAWANSGASAGSHSHGIRQYRDMTAEQWADLQQNDEALYGVLYNNGVENRMTALYDLSAEQIKKLKYSCYTFYAGLSDETREYFDQVIEDYEQQQELTDALQESLTGTTFDELQESFIDNLADMEASAQDFSDDFSEMMRKAMIKAMVQQNFQTELQDIMAMWTDMAGDSDGLTNDERSTLQSKMDEVIKNAKEKADAINSLFDTATGTQSALSGAYATASQESIDLLAGQTNAVRVNQVESINILRSQLEALLSINSSAGQSVTLLQTIANQLASTDTSLRAKGIII